MTNLNLFNEAVLLYEARNVLVSHYNCDNYDNGPKYIEENVPLDSIIGSHSDVVDWLWVTESGVVVSSPGHHGEAVVAYPELFGLPENYQETLERNDYDTAKGDAQMLNNMHVSRFSHKFGMEGSAEIFMKYKSIFLQMMRISQDLYVELNNSQRKQFDPFNLFTGTEHTPEIVIKWRFHNDGVFNNPKRMDYNQFMDVMRV